MSQEDEHEDERARAIKSGVKRRMLNNLRGGSVLFLCHFFIVFL
jgi:hypothetical protein